MLRFLRPFYLARVPSVVAPTKPLITIFHDLNLRMLNHLLRKLNGYSGQDAPTDVKFQVDCRTNEVPSYHAYQFIHHRCINVHPSNVGYFAKYMPALFTKAKESKRVFLHDLDVLSPAQYDAMVAQTVPKNPLVIDWANDLIAIDDEGLDRIMANYLTCGIQTSKDVHVEHAAGDALVPETQWVQPTRDYTHTHTHAYNKKNKYDQHIIHPHVAEFADLF